MRYLSIILSYIVLFFLGIFIMNSTYALSIGSGTVQWSGGLNTNINWNGTFWASSASGTINGIIIRWRIQPILNMRISGSGIIDLWNMSNSIDSSWSVDIEIWTNAINWASVTAASANAWMINSLTWSHVINALSLDGFVDSYRFISSIIGVSDSTAPWFIQGATYSGEIINTLPVTLYTSNKPQNLTNTDDFRLTIISKPNIQTPAWDYFDKVVITVTGNF